MWNRMVGNSRSELSSGSAEGPSLTAGYCNGQRGSYSAASLEKSGSFRESIDNRALSSVSGGNRTTSPLTTAEIPPPSQFLLLDFISLGDQQCSRAVELKRAVGVSPEDHSIGAIQTAVAEELKRFKATISESSSKARDRARLLQESIAKLDRYRGLSSRKRQRSDFAASEKPSSGNIMKTGSQIHQSPSDLATQRLEERNKSLVPNKRMRTPVADVRADGRGTVSMRQVSAADKDKNTPLDKEKNMLRACNGLMPVEDKIGVLPGGEGWDKKMKRKRSVGPVITRPIDSDREFKSSSQQRLSMDSRARPNDGLTFRQSSSGGVIGTMKPENSPQQNGPGNRPMPRGEFDNSSLSNDRKERPGGIEKERAVPKGSNKSNIREDGQMGSQSPLTKGKGSRGPRTTIMNSSSSFQRSTGSVDGWDQTSCLSKVPYLGGATNRKNSLPAVSTSPPMAQWGSQLLPKNTRTRRANLIPPTQPHESSALSEVASSEARNLSNISQQQKPKLDCVLSPQTVSESEESAVIENRGKDRSVHNSEMEVTGSLLPSKKNRPPREEMGDGVRRQGRNGRGSSHLKAGAHLSKEKLDNVDAARPPRIGRPSSDISKGGRPPSKKMSDRKLYGRPSLPLSNGSSDLIGDQDDDHNELLLAADSARKASSQSCSSSFWKNMEPIFSFVNEDAASALKQEIKFLEEVDEGFSVMAESNSTALIPPNLEGADDSKKWLQNIFPLSQRLLAAFIEEDENVEQGNDYACQPTIGLATYEAKNGDKIASEEYESELTFFSRRNGSRDSSCNGYSGSSNFRSLNSRPFSYGNEPMQEMDLRGARGSDVSCSILEFQYSQKCLDDKIMMELQNIGLLLDTVPDLDEADDNELDRDLSSLKGKLYEQMKIKKARLFRLDEAIHKAREVDERRLEKIAMDKLVEMAYKKYTGGRGSHKSGVNRLSKQAALSFAKRVLERCRKYDVSGVSCFREPSLRDALFSSVDGQRPPAGPPSSQPPASGALTGATEEPDQPPPGTRVKKRELLLDDVAGSVLGSPFPGGAKGKRSERDQGSSLRNPKSGRPSGLRGERKTKTKPRQKTAQLSAAGNGLLGRLPEPPPLTGGGTVNEKPSRETEAGFPSLPLESIDGLDVGAELGGQGGDIGSWLCVDEDALQDNDLIMGLEIPMDDLSEINMNF